MKVGEKLLHGKLHLTFRHLRGKTKMINKYQAPPLRASHTLYVDDDPSKATVYLVETSGGIVSGDVNSYRIEMEENTKATFIPQSATKVYPALHEKVSKQEIHISLADQAYLEWYPETTIPFKDAIFQSRTRIEMKDNSTLLFGEILSPGREKSGELFQFKRWKNTFEVWLNGEECLIYDALILEPALYDLTHIGVLEKYTYVGYLWFISPEATHIDENEIQEKLIQSDKIKASITRVDKHGLHLRWMSTDILELKKSMMQCWTILASLCDGIDQQSVRKSS